MLSVPSVQYNTRFAVYLLVFCLLFLFFIFSPFPSSSFSPQQTRSSLSILSSEDRTKRDLVQSPSQEPSYWTPFNVSSFQCVGNEKHHDARAGRGCVFFNLCFSAPTREFIYYQPRPQPLLFDEHIGPIYEFGAFIGLTQFDENYNVFGPRIVREPPASYLPWCLNPPTRHSTSPLAALWLPWSTVDANLGHLLWEEMGTLYYLRRRLSPLLGPVQEKEPDLLRVFSLLKEVPKYELYHKIIRAFLPALSSWHATNDMPTLQESCCFSHVLVGGVERMFYPRIANNIGREEIYFGWRNRIRQLYGLSDPPPPFLPRSPLSRRWPYLKEPPLSKPFQIRIVEKTHSYLGPARRRIQNVQQVFQSLRSHFPRDHITIVGWHDKSFEEQIRILDQTDILISPCGGISMILPFLPVGAHVILMDFYSEKEHLLFEAGVSASMEAAFWDAWPHIHKIYYQVFDRSEVHFDEPWTPAPDQLHNLSFQQDVLSKQDQLDIRDYGNIVVNTTRIVELVRMAQSP